MNIIDTHQHLWDLRQFPCSWCAAFPPLNRSFLLDDYQAAIQGCGVIKTVFVECDVDEPNAAGEARHLQNLSDGAPLIAGIVAGCRPEHTDFPAQLEALLDLPKLRGLRRTLHTAPDATSRSALFAENIRRLAGHRLTFDLCALTRQLPLALALAKKCPDVQFVLDHCGIPPIKERAFDPWKSHLTALAALPNVACKISGLVAYAGENWTPGDLRPWVEHVLACFGWDRVLWGSDWPVCTLMSTLSKWLAASNELFRACSDTERDKLFHQNAARIYRV